MTDRRLITEVSMLIISAISFIVSAFVSIGRSNLGIDDGNLSFAVAIASFGLAAFFLLDISAKGGERIE